MANTGNTPKQVELVLENRQVMGVFLVMAVLCGIFFALGFVVGSSTGSGSAPAAETSEENLPPADKPSAMSAPAYIPKSQQASVAGEASGVQQAAADTDLSFYNNVQTNAPDAPAESDAQQAPAAAPVGPPPEGIVVQVSALTRRGDAENLLNLLKEKDLPVLVTTGPNDALFHVVIGPYKNEKDAEQVKSALEKDGFRPFIRR